MPNKTLIKEPAIQKNTRGRPSLKKQQKRVDSINQAPRRRSYSTTTKFVGSDLIDLNKDPARHSSYVTEIPQFYSQRKASEFIDLNLDPTELDSYLIDLNKNPSEQASYLVDLNQNPSEQDSYSIDLNQTSQSSYINPFLKQIPSIFHPYITNIQNVRGDGNCGFRSISVCLGYGEDQWLYVREQLLDELLSLSDVYAGVFTEGFDELRNSLCCSQSPAPLEHWMLMPETGILVANRFGVILTYLTNQGSLTFFPLWKGPEEFQHHRIITISHVNNDHYVMVQLEGDHPMPIIAALWNRHKSLSAATWQTMYMQRLEFYKRLRPCNSETPFINLEDC